MNHESTPPDPIRDLLNDWSTRKSAELNPELGRVVLAKWTHRRRRHRQIVTGVTTLGLLLVVGSVWMANAARGGPRRTETVAEVPKPFDSELALQQIQLERLQIEVRLLQRRLRQKLDPQQPVDEAVATTQVARQWMRETLEQFH